MHCYLLIAAGDWSGLGSLVSICAVVHASSAFSPPGAAQWACAAVAWCTHASVHCWTQWFKPHMGWTCASAMTLLLLMELFSRGVAGNALWCPCRLARDLKRETQIMLSKCRENAAKNGAH